MEMIDQILLLHRILWIMIQVIQRYGTNGFSVFKSIESHGSLNEISKQIDS